MKYLINLLLVSTLLLSCNNSRVEQLEAENLQLRNELDSIKASIDLATTLSREKYEKTLKKGIARMDSLINQNETKVVLTFISCDDPEADIELVRSIDLIEEKLKQHGIEIYKLQGLYSEDFECGYELADGKRRKKIQGAQSVNDLASLIEKFYDIELLE